MANQEIIETGSRTTLHLALLTVFALVLTGPTLLHGIPDLSHDGIMHRHGRNPSRNSLADEQQWWTRVCPVFVYPTLSTTVSVLISPLIGHRYRYGWLLARISCVKAMSLSGYTSYSWLCDLTDPASTLFGGTLYLVMPSIQSGSRVRTVVVRCGIADPLVRSGHSSWDAVGVRWTDSELRLVDPEPHANYCRILAGTSPPGIFCIFHE